MVTYQYDLIDGQRVEKNIAKQYRRWAADFKVRTGFDLHISCGVRTVAEQEAGYERYLHNESGGVKWAKPNESSHCEIGPSGPRALDIRDSGPDAGVTVHGTRRWDIAVETGKRYGFTWGGWGVPASEGWHFENHVVKIGVYGIIGSVASVVKTVVAKAAGKNPILTWQWTGIQRMLKAEFRYTGRIDNKAGDGSKMAMRRFLNARGYAQRACGFTLRVAPVFTVNDVKAIQQWLKEKWGYTGLVDGKPGPNTHAAWNRAEAANNRAHAGIR